ncbi:uncharacterized protein LOC126669274 [Mercurialis annua]|uniref:uncharacterized protein LOC126669274 n=1 Tax=Mercurialis annua TaxID=3986 RepID=UPI0024AD8F12|nr:uncharacterized protein LOC126669274 [Mercurialis annua]
MQHRHDNQSSPMEILIILLFSFSFTSVFTTSKAIDTISATQSIRDGGQTVVSADGSFELGFFSIKSNRYLGVWFKKISQGTVVWVANREIPLSNSSGLLQFDDRGGLILLNQENLSIWSANSSRAVHNPVAQLLDSGNFVIRDEMDVDPENYLWQSFHHPDRTFMPGMKIGRLAGGVVVHATSWKSIDDPSEGEFIYQLDSSGLQMIIASKSVITGRSGPWNGIGQSGLPFLKPNTIFNYSFVMSENETYYTFELVNKSVFTRVVLNENGVLNRYAWIDRTQQWQRISSAPADNCDSYDICGADGSCDITNTPLCSCLNRFVPKLENNWNAADWSDGCIRRKPLNCTRGDVFIKYSNLKLPDMLNYSTNSNLTMEECDVFCLKDCSCVAYASSNIVTRRGCYFWFGDLIDIKQFNEDGGQDLFIRMAFSELDESSSSKKRRVLVATLVSSAGCFLLILCICLFIKNKRRNQKKNAQSKWENNADESYSIDNHDEDLELPHFDFIVVARATNNFSFNGMLGEGGFGPVYKGILRDGQEVAVKRLSKESRQGLHEFMNELKCIAKLQHRNLVKLLGYCIYQDERMLIYEYMPNKSLDCYIFDDNQSKLLDWNVRFRIIVGISRGLLYLHQDSRLRIIHRDLKLSNILLDKELNPKISDFGMARIFGGNETAANTKRVVGTYGYMSPEYAIDGLFSMKSDVFSYGVLVLEIISGQRNRGFTHPDHELNLVGHAWKLFKEGRYLELIDASATETCNLSEVVRAMHVGLLCVQHNPEDRPNMSLVVLMLSSEGPLPEPKEPGFFTDRKLFEGESPSTKQNLNSVNELTITLIDARLQHRHDNHNSSMEILNILLFCLSLTSIFTTAQAIDTISATQSISDGGETIISAGGSFELGFFSINSNRYLGVWFKKISEGTVVWVANREISLTNSSGLLHFDNRGSLILLNQENLTVWSANTSRPVQNPIAQLLDSGNFVIRDENDVDPENYLWQSFHHPDKTVMPGMKIGRLAGGVEVHATSWKSIDDPSKGEYSFHPDSSGLQMVIAKDSVIIFRSGPWNGISQSGLPFLKPNPVYYYTMVISENESYYTFDLVNKSVFSRLVLNENGVNNRYVWIDRTQLWHEISYAPRVRCDTYDLCGAQASCDINNTTDLSLSKDVLCSCLNRFVPNLESNRNATDWSSGCVRRTPLDCQRGDGFIKYSNLKLPDMLNYSTNSSLTIKECDMLCLKNCSCMAYASSNIVTGRGCYFWFGDLIDIKQYNEDGGQDLFIRVAFSELDEIAGFKKRWVLMATLLTSAGCFLLILCVCLFIRNKRRKQNKNAQSKWENYSIDNHEEDLELPHFDFIVVARATNNFSFDGMLGKGGFGPVYKGILRDGQEVAVKRLSKESRQGLHEFMNELKCIAKLQHRNLVKLLGYCIYLDERMLIYEYMPNKSLDYYIFDDNQGKHLDWNVRFHIIMGISRGLLYLHQDSRLRIIHRDLKLSNILLDKEMNPKISDFGMARIFGGNETAANTTRVVGTYGYMSPEYAIDGLFSIKSDVFSFGALVLEIISGQRNRGFTHPDHQLNLLGHAWKLFKEGRYLELIDDSTMETCSLSEVLRTMHVGLLCVQHNPEDRPNMSSVVLMLSSEGPLPEPKEPGFFTERKLFEGESASSKQNLNSVNELTLALIDAR